MKKGRKIHKAKSRNSFKKQIPQEQHNGIPITLYPNITVLYRFMPLEAFEATLQSWSLKATLCYEANDPFEFTPQSTKPHSALDIRANSPICSPPPFLCFSRKITTASMWGLYADSGKGVCLVFGFPTKDNDWTQDNRATTKLKIDANAYAKSKEYANAMNAATLIPVNYCHERVVRPEEIAHNEESLASWFQQLVATKDKTWEHEDEVRLISDYRYASSVENGRVCFSWPMNYLLGVVVGPRCKYSPAIIQGLLSSAYKNKGKGQNYFHSKHTKLNARFIDNFIVSQAYYHWRDYEMTCIPWGDRIKGTEFVQLLAIASCRLQGTFFFTRDLATKTDSSINPRDDWQDICQNVYNQNENTVMLMRTPIETYDFIQSPIYSLN